KEVQQDLLDRLGRAFAKPVRSSTARPSPPAVLRVETPQGRGSSMGVGLDFRQHGLTSVDPKATVEVDLGMDFTAEELERIAGWLRAMPDVTVSLSDIWRQRGYKHDSARIAPFAGAKKLQL